MRMIEITLFCLLFPLFSGIFVSGIKETSALQEKCAKKSAELSKNMLIARTFERLCEENAPESEFDSFRADYASLFPLDAIFVETLGLKDKKRLLKCSWESEGKRFSVLSVTEK